MPPGPLPPTPSLKGRGSASPGVAMSTASKPLLSANWFRVAAVRPRLREHVRITRQHFRGDRWFVLEDLVENTVHRFAPAARQAIGLMDGTHTLDAIWTALGRTRRGAPDPGRTDPSARATRRRQPAGDRAAAGLFRAVGPGAPRHRRQAVAAAGQSALPSHSALRSGSLPRRHRRRGASAGLAVGIAAVARRGRLGRRARGAALERADPRPRRPGAGTRQHPDPGGDLPGAQAAARAWPLLLREDLRRLGARGGHHDAGGDAGAVCRCQRRQRVFQ